MYTVLSLATLGQLGLNLTIRIRVQSNPKVESLIPYTQLGFGKVVHGIHIKVQSGLITKDPSQLGLNLNPD